MIIRDIVFIYHLREDQLLNWHSRVHSHEESHYELHYFVSGSGKFKNGNSVYKIERGHLFFTYPNQVHGILPGDLADPLTYYAVLFDLNPQRDTPLVNLTDPSIMSAFPLSIGPNYRLRFEDMKNRYNSTNEFQKMSAQFELLAFLFDLFGRIQTKESDIRPDHDSGTDIYVEQAMDLFQKHIFDNVYLSEIADTLHISEEYLIKVFRRKIGITPMRYYQNLKMEAGSSLLLNTTQSIKEISWKLGFSSQYHFSRNFKIFAGQSPSEYRLRYFTDNPTKYPTRIISN